MSNSSDQNTEGQAGFAEWLQAFEAELTLKKPFGMNDQAIGEFAKMIQSEFDRHTLPRSFGFDKLLTVIVHEAAYNCGLSVDDFPESEVAQEELLEIAQEVRTRIQAENVEGNTEHRKTAQDIRDEAINTVLKYDTEAPNTPPEISITNPEMEEHLRSRGRK